MKKIFALLLALSMVLCFAACGGDKEDESKDETKSTATETETEATGSDKETETDKEADTEATTEATTEAKTEATTEATTGDAEAADWEVLLEEYDEVLRGIFDLAEEYSDVENEDDLPEDVKNELMALEERQAEIEDEIEVIIAEMEENDDEEGGLALAAAMQELMESLEEDYPALFTE